MQIAQLSTASRSGQNRIVPQVHLVHISVDALIVLTHIVHTLRTALAIAHPVGTVGEIRPASRAHVVTLRSHRLIKRVVAALQPIMTFGHISIGVIAIADRRTIEQSYGTHRVRTPIAVAVITRKITLADDITERIVSVADWRTWNLTAAGSAVVAAIAR